MRKNNVGLQELAELMRDVAYSDNQSHGISWSLRVLHPKTNEGDVGFSGGIWNNFNKSRIPVSISFSYSESKGIYGFKSWRNMAEVRHSFEETPSFDEFKELLIKEFAVEELYKHN